MLKFLTSSQPISDSKCIDKGCKRILRGNGNSNSSSTDPSGVSNSCAWGPAGVTTEKRAAVAITEEQVRGIFNRYDANKDGLLSKKELKDAFTALGSRMPALRVFFALQHADTNGDGHISQDEFEKLVKYTLKRGYKLT